MTLNLEALSILVVDDNKHMHSFVKTILNAMHVTSVRYSENAPDAFIEMRHWHPDFIITDWAMLPLDGLDFVRLMRRGDDSPNPYIPIILLTGHTEMGRVIEARDAGINEFLAKPISIKSLFTSITSIVQNPRPFVKSNTYFGPCRRRGTNLNFKGPDRRKYRFASDNPDKARSAAI